MDAKRCRRVLHCVPDKQENITVLVISNTVPTNSETGSVRIYGNTYKYLKPANAPDNHIVIPGIYDFSGELITFL